MCWWINLEASYPMAVLLPQRPSFRMSIGCIITSIDKWGSDTQRPYGYTHKISSGSVLFGLFVGSQVVENVPNDLTSQLKNVHFSIVGILVHMVLSCTMWYTALMHNVKSVYCSCRRCVWVSWVIKWRRGCLSHLVCVHTLLVKVSSQDQVRGRPVHTLLCAVTGRWNYTSWLG